MTRPITPTILARALDEERRGAPRPPRSVLRELLAKLSTQGTTLVVTRPTRAR